MANNVLLLLSALEFDSYKSFSRNETHQLELGTNITLIIGKNNSGKSSVIDVIESLFRKVHIADIRGVDKDKLRPAFKLDEGHILEGFYDNQRNLALPNKYRSGFEYARQFLGKSMSMRWQNLLVPNLNGKMKYH
ncbi:AAA domain-containing protein [Butyrivibrio sp. ob235]|uniref:AAA family ATPase n=1 Tax=Butyrivibrio sp. ob235 TaxID=1761780 RepID=UPI0008B5C57B|nr:AAA family ATPase [Butyrivibrio sp. ob235]SEL98411.1 AAA domain-containing protein [Butyrivibrio sp. ob235]